MGECEEMKVPDGRQTGRLAKNKVCALWLVSGNEDRVELGIERQHDLWLQIDHSGCSWRIGLEIKVMNR